jgi:hypothetical protein
MDAPVTELKDANADEHRLKNLNLLLTFIRIYK